MKLFRSRRFEAHWFETGTPRFLVDTLIRRGVVASDLDDVHASEALLSEFDVDAIAPEALLFQTGYLTIRGEERRGGRTVYRLGYPNREVRQGLSESLLDRLAPDPRRERHAGRLYDVLAAGDAAGVEAPLRALLAGIPHDWHSPPIVAFGSDGCPTGPARSLHRSTAQTPRNAIARYEGYWASVFYAHFAALGLDVAAEDATSRGRLDLAVRLGAYVYLFEFKVAGPAAGVGGRREGELPADDRRGAGATEGARLRGQVPRPGLHDPPDRRGDRRRLPRHRRVRNRTRLSGAKRTGKQGRPLLDALRKMTLVPARRLEAVSSRVRRLSGREPLR